MLPLPSIVIDFAVSVAVPPKVLIEIFVSVQAFADGNGRAAAINAVAINAGTLAILNFDI